MAASWLSLASRCAESVCNAPRLLPRDDNCTWSVDGDGAAPDLGTEAGGWTAVEAAAPAMDALLESFTFIGDGLSGLLECLSAGGMRDFNGNLKRSGSDRRFRRFRASAAKRSRAGERLPRPRSSGSGNPAKGAPRCIQSPRHIAASN